MTTMELQGHGDPLLAVAMKGTKLKTVEGGKDTAAAKVSHSVTGQGDPLFQSVLEHDSPRMNPLHAEFKGQGDPLMDAFIEEWHVVAKGAEEKTETDVHGEMKHEGDPLLTEAILHDAQTFGTKQ